MRETTLLTTDPVRLSKSDDDFMSTEATAELLDMSPRHLNAFGSKVVAQLIISSAGWSVTGVLGHLIGPRRSFEGRPAIRE
jgi:hypothetical protein